MPILQYKEDPESNNRSNNKFSRKSKSSNMKNLIPRKEELKKFPSDQKEIKYQWVEEYQKEQKHKFLTKVEGKEI